MDNITCLECKKEFEVYQSAIMLVCPYCKKMMWREREKRWKIITK